MRSPDDPRRAAAHDPAALRATDRCPNCGDRRSEAGRCTDCGLDLTRPALAGVHALSLRAAELLERAARTAAEADAVLAERAALLNREREASLADRARRTEFAVPAEFSGAPTEPAGAPAPSARPGMPSAGAAPSAPAPAGAASARPEAPAAAPHGPGAGAPAAPVATPFAAPAPPMPALPIPPSPSHPRGPLPPPGAPPAASAPPAPPTPPRRRITPQSLLLITGVAFLSIAAAVFLTVAFVLFDLVTKAIIVAGVTTAVVVGASLLRRTRLVSTAEGIGALGVVLLGLDAWAIRALDFFGLAAPPTALYWGVALLVLGALLHLWGRVSRLRAPLLASAVALPVGVAALIGALLSDVLELRGTFLVAAATAAASSALAPVLHRRAGRVDRLEAALMLGAGQAVAAAGLLSAIGAAFGEPLAPTAIGAGTLVAGLAAQLAVLVRRDELHSLPALRGSAAVLGVGAWTVAVLVGGQALLAPEIPGVALAPLAALAIPAADLARGRPLLRGAGNAGVITALIAVLPQFAVGLGLPLLGLWAVRQVGRADSPATSEGSGALLLTGALLLAVGIAAALAYRRFGDAAAHRHRGALAGGAAAVGLVIAAIALPVPGAPIALAALAVLAAAGAIALRGRATPLADALRAPVGLVHLLAAAAILGAVPFGTAGWAGAALLGLGTIAARLAAARGRRSVGLSIALVVAALLVLVALELARGFDAWSAPAALLAVLVPLGLVALRGAARPHPVDRGVLVAAATATALLLALLRWSAPAPGLPLAPGLVLAAGALVAIAVALLPLVERPTAPRPGSSQRAPGSARLPAERAPALVPTLAAVPRADAAAAPPRPTAAPTPAMPAPSRGRFARGAALLLPVPLALIAAAPAGLPIADALRPLAQHREVLAAGVMAVLAAILAAAVLHVAARRIPGAADPVERRAGAIGLLIVVAVGTGFVVAAAASAGATGALLLAGLAAAPSLLALASTARPGGFEHALPWATPAVIAVAGPQLLESIVDGAWPVLLAAPIALALLGAAAVLASRPAAASAIGRGGTAVLVAGGLVALLVGALITEHGAARGWLALGALLLAVGLAAVTVIARLPLHFGETRMLVGALLPPLAAVAALRLAVAAPGAVPVVPLPVGPAALAIAAAAAIAALAALRLPVAVLADRPPRPDAGPPSEPAPAGDAAPSGGRTSPALDAAPALPHALGVGALAVVVLALAFALPLVADGYPSLVALLAALALGLAAGALLGRAESAAPARIAVGLAVLAAVLGAGAVALRGGAEPALERPLVALLAVVGLLAAVALRWPALRREPAGAPVAMLAAATAPAGLWAAAAAAPIPVGGAWWPLVAAVLPAVVAAPLALAGRRRGAAPLLLAAAVSACALVPFALLVGGRHFDTGHLAAALLALAAAGTATTFAAPAAAPAALAVLRGLLVATAIGGGIALLDVAADPIASLAQLPAALLAATIAVAMRRDGAAPAVDGPPAPARPGSGAIRTAFAAAAPPIAVLGLVLAARLPDPLHALHAAGFAIAAAALAAVAAVLGARAGGADRRAAAAALAASAGVSAVLAMLVAVATEAGVGGIADLIVALPVSLLLLVAVAASAAPRLAAAAGHVLVVTSAITPVLAAVLLAQEIPEPATTAAVAARAAVIAATAAAPLLALLPRRLPLLPALPRAGDAARAAAAPPRPADRRPPAGTAASPLVAGGLPADAAPLDAARRGSLVLATVLGALAVAAIAVRLLTHFDGLAVEAFSVPFGLAAAIAGAVLLRRHPDLRSWPALGPALAALLGIGVVAELIDPTWWRIGLVTVLVVAALVAGLLGRLQAPVIAGAIVGLVHAVIAIRRALPDLAVPWWAWLAAAGALLVVIAATYEARKRDAARLTIAVRALR